MPLITETRPMGRPLRLQLPEFGCELSPDEFRELLVDLKVEMFPAFTDERLSFTRDEAEEYCGVVRRRAECSGLTREFILANLNNVRKGGSRS